ncbi:MAG: HDIG domain-containing metalloprotein [Pseudomonadota bacterium]
MTLLRQTANRSAGVALSLLLAAILIPLATIERWLDAGEPEEGRPAALTLRLPNFGLSPGSDAVPLLDAGRIALARGERPSASKAKIAASVLAALPSLGYVGGSLLLGITLLCTLFTSYLRSVQGRARLLRTQLALIGSVAVVAILAKLFLLFSAQSALLFPLGALALLIGTSLDRSVGMASAIVLAVVVAALSPFDVVAAIVFSVQGIAGLLAQTGTKRRHSFLLAGVAAGFAGSAAYVAIACLWAVPLPFGELWYPLSSGSVATLASGVMTGPIALLLRPLVQIVLGDVPKAKLVELADLENPLLKKIATEAPGTWQHSLATANMAEMAANAIGANALLVRVGALYHDVGKTQQPEFYSENLTPGQMSPHDNLAPEASATAIFSHVTEGVQLGREHSLPEALIDFIHMHHGDGVLEFFWNKCLEQGNPARLTSKTFRYPGTRPQSREAGILALCDAVEAASRSLKQPDARAIEVLVQRIVYSRLHQGLFDESGLSIAELKVLARTLTEILWHAHHFRPEYPWQRQEADSHSHSAPAAGAPIQESPGLLAAIIHHSPGAEYPPPQVPAAPVRTVSTEETTRPVSLHQPLASQVQASAQLQMPAQVHSQSSSPAQSSSFPASDVAAAPTTPAVAPTTVAAATTVVTGATNAPAPTGAAAATTTAAAPAPVPVTTPAIATGAVTASVPIPVHVPVTAGVQVPAPATSAATVPVAAPGSASGTATGTATGTPVPATASAAASSPGQPVAASHLSTAQPAACSAAEQPLPHAVAQSSNGEARASLASSSDGSLGGPPANVHTVVTIAADEHGEPNAPPGANAAPADDHRDGIAMTNRDPLSGTAPVVVPAIPAHSMTPPRRRPHPQPQPERGHDDDTPRPVIQPEEHEKPK